MASPVTPPSTLRFLQPSNTSEQTEEKGPELNQERALHSNKTRFWVTVIIISAYTAAIALAGVHHAFLASLGSRDATKYSLDERAWVGRANNLLSKIIATSLAVVVATVLIQAVRVSLSGPSYF
jgi:hypothetical protein